MEYYLSLRVDKRRIASSLGTEPGGEVVCKRVVYANEITN